MIGYVIGDSDMITGFRLVGVEGVEATTVEETKTALSQVLRRNDVAIIILSNEFTNDSSIRDEIDRIRQEHVTPMILEVPASRGTATQKTLSETISKILGIKL
jgi:vacuolar-type H+-ATPase subunit F/Vma7